MQNTTPVAIQELLAEEIALVSGGDGIVTICAIKNFDW
jgi:hypothetical protein